jgi:hypothetical protein
METLSIFEMTHRGYVALVGGGHASVHTRTRRRTRRH